MPQNVEYCKSVGASEAGEEGGPNPCSAQIHLCVKNGRETWEETQHSLSHSLASQSIKGRAVSKEEGHGPDGMQKRWIPCLKIKCPLAFYENVNENFCFSDEG